MNLMQYLNNNNIYKFVIMSIAEYNKNILRKEIIKI